MQRGHVDVVDVRPLLAVDFDVDEAAFISAAVSAFSNDLVRHHMAPVAGGVADREQDRAVAPLGLGERLGAPGAPVHGIMRVLQQIGRGLLAEQIAASALPAFESLASMPSSRQRVALQHSLEADARFRWS